jgi:hypothetical protein
MPRGRLPNLKRRQQIAEYRTAGLSLTEIGRKLGISRQRVQFILTYACNTRLVPVHCAECGIVITQLRGVADNNRSVWCLACLAKRPQATFGQQLSATETAGAPERSNGLPN